MGKIKTDRSKLLVARIKSKQLSTDECLKMFLLVPLAQLTNKCI